MIDNSQGLKDRAQKILSAGFSHAGAPSEASQFATTLLTNLYGSQSPQLAQFQSGCEAIARNSPSPVNMSHHLWLHAEGTIQNAVAEMDAGLIVRLRVVVADEVLAELLRLAKEIMAGQTEQEKNVSAVLVAAYEDLLRRMAEEFAGVKGRPALHEVVISLKNQGVLVGGEVATAQGYLKFRNDSLHADWKNVSPAQVHSCLAFVEALMIKHFS